MKMPWEGAVESVIGVIGELVTDKDLANKLTFEVQKLDHEFNKTMLQTKTVPWVDAVVKILYALKQFIRPLGAAAMTAFGMYAHVKGLDIGEASQVILDGAFPAWGASRWSEKRSGVEKPPTKKDDWPLDSYD